FALTRSRHWPPRRSVTVPCTARAKRRPARVCGRNISDRGGLRDVAPPWAGQSSARSAISRRRLLYFSTGLSDAPWGARSVARWDPAAQAHPIARDPGIRAPRERAHAREPEGTGQPAPARDAPDDLGRRVGATEDTAVGQHELHRGHAGLG